MNLTFIGHEDRYAVEQLQMSLFGPNREGEMVSALHRGKIWLTAVTTFTIDGKVYSVASMPTVNDPTFVFEDLSDDGMETIRLSMPSDASETEVLCMLPEDGSPELCFTATDGDFSRLTDHLGSN